MIKVSASRIKAFKGPTGCMRRGAWSYLYGEKEPFAKSAQAGTEVHHVLETFPPSDMPEAPEWNGYDVGRMAAALQAASPADILHREQAIDAELDGVMFTARVDFQTETLVGDYKTTSQKKYVKKLDELETDPQRLLYQRITDRPDSLWLYGVWKDFSVHPVVIPGSPKDRERFKLHVLQPAEEILTLSTDVDPLTLEPNTLACGLYPPNGCQFQDRCYNKRTGQLITSGDTKPAAPKEAMSILDAFKEVEAVHLAGGTPAEHSPNTDFDTSREVVAQRQSEKSASVDTPSRTDSSDPRLIGTLYIDSYPVQGVDGVVNAGGLIAAAAASVCSDAHVLHSQLVDFGKGQHMLAAQLVHDLKASGEFYPHLYLETRSSEGKAALFELSRLAHVVVKGLI